jgi:hypothetical protein
LSSYCIFSIVSKINIVRRSANGSTKPNSQHLTYLIFMSRSLPFHCAITVPCYNDLHMTMQRKVESLIRQVEELPEEAQAELVQSLVEMRAPQAGIYHLDDDERAALARSAEDERLGRFASEDDMAKLFARYGA